LEVAQLGRALARGLGANVLLTEAICLAHDLGHAPFGHAGEHILNDLMHGYGGFNHNTQSYRVVTELEEVYADFRGLNLTYETREGMLKHETDYDRSEAVDYAPEKRASLEAQIANLADEIAYNAHDLDDGMRSGLLSPYDLRELSIWRDLCSMAGWEGEGPFTPMMRHEVIRELIGRSVEDVLITTDQALESNHLDTPEKVQLHDDTVVGYSADFGGEVKELKRYLYENMYHHYRLVRMQQKAERIISDLFNAYLKEPAMLPNDVQKRLEASPLHRVIADYLAGMTDRYALDEWNRLFDPYARA
jgi:dGTPase